MPNYKGRRKGTRRIVIWQKGKPLEWIIEGSKADGDTFESQKRIDLQAFALSKRTAPTLSDFCLHQYKPYAETNLKRSTWRNVRVYQVATLTEFFGEMKLTEISTEQIEAFKRQRVKSVIPNSVNNELRLLRTILNGAKETGFPTSDPKIIKFKVRETRAKAWTEPELQRLFASTRDLKPWLLPMVLFLASTGCRKGEAIAAEWD